MEPIDSHSPGPTQASRRSSLREVAWRWSDVLIGLAPLVLARMTGALMDPVSGATTLRWLWIPLTLLAMAWMLGCPLWVARRRHAGLPQLPRFRAALVEAFFALLALLSVCVTLSVVSHVLAYLFGEAMMPSNPLEPLVRSPNRLESLTFMILAVSVAPLAEETLFRGLLYNALRQRLHVVLAVTLQAVVFGLLHPFNLADSIPVIVVAMALAALYEWRRTLLAPVLLHALVNTASVAAMAWSATAYANAPVLGVQATPHEGGCLVTTVKSGSAAEAAGLQIGDVLTAVDGEPVADLRGISRVVRRRQVGDTVLLEFKRSGNAYSAEAVLKSRQE